MTPAVLALRAAGVDFSIHEYDRAASDRDFGVGAATGLGLSEDRVFKTLVVAADDGLAVAIIPVNRKLSMKLVAEAIGTKKVSMADRASAERSTGYIIGGISPFGQRRQLRTVVDEAAELFELIYVSGGKRGMDVAVAPADLVGLLSATVAALTA